MNNREQLHQLIHKLSKGEKRAFKLYVKKYNTKKDQKVVQLFDLLNKMPEYNEEKLLEVFSKKQLTYHLHKLKNSLLNALSDFHFKNNTESIGEIINRIELGFEYEDTTIIEDNLKQGLELTKKEKYFAFKLPLLQYKQRLKTFQRNLVELVEVDKQILTQTNYIHQVALYELLWAETFYWMTQNTQKENVSPLIFSNQKLTQLFNAPLDEDAGFNEKENYLMAKSFHIEVTIKNFPECYERCLDIEEQLYGLYLKHDKPIKPNFLFNMILDYLRLNKIKEAEDKLNELGILKKHKNNSFGKDNKSLIYITILAMYFFSKKEYKSIIEMEPKIQTLIANIQNNVNDYNTLEQLIMIFAVVCFKRQAYNECLDWILKIKKASKENRKSQSVISTILQFLELLSHLELGNTNVLDSLLKSIKYSISVKETVFSEEENEIIRIIKAIVKQNKFIINTDLFDKNEPFNHYKFFVPYLEEKQKELAQKK